MVWEWGRKIGSVYKEMLAAQKAGDLVKAEEFRAEHKALADKYALKGDEFWDFTSPSERRLEKRVAEIETRLGIE